MLGDILLVEDEPDLVTLFWRVLVRAGYRVRIANEGSLALRAIAERPPAVMVLDLRLPNLNGATVLERLRERGIRLPVIVITADLRAAEALTDSSILKCLIKPFRMTELLEAIRPYSADHDEG